jgi:hypothetical protein
MRAAILTACTFPFLLLLFAPPAAQPADPRPDELAEKVNKAIHNGVQYLRGKQVQSTGSWETETTAYPGGTTSLALLALLNAGVPPDDEAIKKGLEYLRKRRPRDDSDTYVVALQTMVFAKALPERDAQLIQQHVDWLLDARHFDGDKRLLGWSYGKPGKKTGDFRPDNSNTQYALLGLHAGIEAKANVDAKALKGIQQFYIDSAIKIDKDEWYWDYRKDGKASFTMTTAGLCGLLITGMDLQVGRQKLRDDGSAENCGNYEESKEVANALRWLGNHFPARLTKDNAADRLGIPYYALYGIERAGRLSGQRYFGGHDWYEVGSRFLVDNQNTDGSWDNRLGRKLGFDSSDGWEVINSSFALLFLSKGRTPVLVTKLAYGAPDYNGWNNKRNDVRFLTEFASRELFNKLPMAWQIFDVRSRDTGDDKQFRKLAAELSESPIVYFNGHDYAPRGRERALLKEYLANGGFIFAEACCGRKNFERDMEELVKDICDGAKLEVLEAEHPVWSAKFHVSPGKPFVLKGVKQGCKTVVIYCPSFDPKDPAHGPMPLSGYWEDNQNDKGKAENSKKAFELGANIIAYATGMEPPRPRGTKVNIPEENVAALTKRGYIQVAQLRHQGFRQPPEQGGPMFKLMAAARADGLDVILKTDVVSPTVEAVKEYPFLYMHGRGQFTFDAKDVEPLRFRLKSGGTLLADACCGAKLFDESFRELMKVMWAEDKLSLEQIPTTDELFSKELNGTEIKEVRCRTQTDQKEPQLMPPELWGVKYNGRWMVIYSRYDLGCALEGSSVLGCIGYDHNSAERLGKAAVRYALRR